MTGKQIANNLKKSKEKWSTGSLYDKYDKSYCAIGLKLHERGIPNAKLSWHSAPWLDEPIGLGLSDNECDRLTKLANINDDCSSKEIVIERLLTPECAKTNFPIEKLAKLMMPEQRKP